MKILVLVHEFPPIGGGGGRAAYDICRGLVQRGHQITVLTSHLHNLAKSEMVEGIQVYRLPSLRKEAYRASLISMSTFVITGLLKGLETIGVWSPDIIHSHFAVPAGALGWILSWLTGVPYILTIHLGDVPGGVPEKTDRWFRWIRPFTPPIWRRARRVVAVSKYTQELAAKLYTVNMEIIPNGVELSQESSHEIKVQSPVQVVFAGRFMPQKNPVQVVKILSELRNLDWRCSMMGDGPLFDAVQREVNELRLSDRFKLTGWVSPENVLSQFDKSDILFMPSLSEGLPVTGVQALAKGLALVVSKVGGFVDLVTEGKNGFLVEPTNSERFVNCLRGLISNPDTLMLFRKASLAKAHEFDLSRVITKYEEILQNSARGK